MCGECPGERWQREVRSASRTRAAARVLAIRELAQQYGLLDKVTITSSSREVLGAAQELVPDVQRGLVAEYAWLDPLKVAQNYGCQDRKSVAKGESVDPGGRGHKNTKKNHLHQRSE